MSKYNNKSNPIPSFSLNIEYEFSKEKYIISHYPHILELTKACHVTWYNA